MRKANTPMQTSVQIKQQIIQADITRGYSALSVGDGDDVLSLAEGKTQRCRDSTSTSSLAGSWRVALRYGDGAGATGGSAGVAGGAALTGVGAMTRSNSSAVGRRRAVAKMAGA